MSHSSSTYRLLKRALDLVGASLLLVGLSPLLALVAACIWWDDGGPIFFIQTRAGQYGEPFRIVKFRTLTAEPNDPTHPSEHLTQTGPLLRRWALDELPQLWNVLRGDMSFVGPRPTLLTQTEQYGPHEATRLRVRPGLTGWAQIHGRNALSWPERIDLDVWYVKNRCLRLDLSILLQTPEVLIRGIGVYGPQQRNPSFPSSPSSPHD